MPGGWMMWILEQYGINYKVVAASDFQDLASKFDVILMPDGITKQRIVNGLDPEANDPAEFGLGGRRRRPRVGASEDVRRERRHAARDRRRVETARDLLDLPIEKAYRRRRRASVPGHSRRRRVSCRAGAVDRALRDAFTSPARLMQVLRDRVALPENLFYCPGSLLQNEFDPTNPVAWGMPPAWPIFFESDQAYRLRPGFGIETAVAARYPRQNILQSGWLLGEEYLKDQANIVSFKVGKGFVVTYGSQVDFRAQPRATFKVLFNGMFHGPSTEISAAQMGKLVTATTNNEQQ